MIKNRVEVIEKVIDLYNKDWDKFYTDLELIKNLDINNNELEVALKYFCKSEDWGVWADYSEGDVNYQIQPRSYIHDKQERYNRLEDRLKKKYGKIGIKFAHLRLCLRIELENSKCLYQLMGKNNVDKLKNMLV